MRWIVRCSTFERATISPLPREGQRSISTEAISVAYDLEVFGRPCFAASSGKHFSEAECPGVCIRDRLSNLRESFSKAFRLAARRASEPKPNGPVSCGSVVLSAPPAPRRRPDPDVRDTVRPLLSRASRPSYS